MRKFSIKVNGIAYEVEVEEGGSAAVSAPAAAVAAAAAPAPVAVQTAAPAPVAVQTAAPAARQAPSAGKTGSEAIKAPMPGTILAIQVAVGDSVKKGQVLCILEAMKMENEIVSSRDGIIAGIHTAKGASVGAGDLLISLE